MNIHEATSNPECATFAPLLPLLDTGGLPIDEEAMIREHLAGCARCRERSAAYDISSSALRRHAGLDTTHSRVPLVTFDDVLHAVAEEDAPVLSIPSAPAADPRSPRRTLSGVAALAAVLLIAVLAHALFSSRPGPGTGGHPTTPFNRAALAHAIVYTGTADGIYAIHGADGTLAWRYPATDRSQEKSPYGIGCLTLSSGILYACSPDGIIAVRATDGTLLWHHAFPETVSVLSPRSQGDFANLGIANGVVYVSTVAGTGSEPGAPPPIYAVFALNATTGNVLWRHVTDEPLRSAPAAANDVVYIATRDSLETLRSGDGTLLWRSPLGGGAAPEGTSPTGVIAAAITATASVVYVSTLENLATRPATTEGSASLVATPDIYQISVRDGSHLWKSGYPSCPCMTPHPAVVWQGHVFYAEDNSLWQLFAAPAELGWRFTGYGELAGPVLVDGMLYLTDIGQDPTTHDTDTLALDPTSGRALWRTGTQGGADSRPPAGAGGAVFSGGGAILYALRADTGGVLWRYQTGGNLQTTPPIISLS